VVSVISFELTLSERIARREDHGGQVVRQLLQDRVFWKGKTLNIQETGKPEGDAEQGDEPT